MVIVFVIDNYNSFTDGTAMTARRFFDELERLGHEVRVVSYDKNGENQFGLKEHRIPLVSYVAQKSNIVFAKYDKAVLEKAMTGADLVHLFLPFQVQRKALRLARKMQIPVSAAFHLHPENITKNAGIKRTPFFLRSFIFWMWKKCTYSKVDHIHCPSQFIADELKAHGYKAKNYIISNGVSDSFKPDAMRLERNKNQNVTPFGKNGKKFEILMTGRYANEKRQDLLIEAVKNSPHANDIHITFAGIGPKKAKLMKLAEGLPCKASFKFFKQGELMQHIQQSDLYVHAADIEVEGISCIEAFSCGLVPVIGNAKRSATKQFVIDKRCSFEAGNAKSLQERIDYWFNHPKELNEMSQKYIEYSKEFSLGFAVKRAVDMFNETKANDYFKYVNVLKEKQKLQKAMHKAFGLALDLPDILAQTAKDQYDPAPNAHLSDNPYDELPVSEPKRL